MTKPTATQRLSTQGGVSVSGDVLVPLLHRVRLNGSEWRIVVAVLISSRPVSARELALGLRLDYGFVGTLYLVQVGGQREPRVYKRRSVAFGAVTRTWLESVDRADLARSLTVSRAHLGSGRRRGAACRQWVRVRMSPMTQLFGALVSALSVETPAATNPAVPDDPDWGRNLKWATARLGKRLGGEPPWPTKDVIQVLARHDKNAVCKACHTPLLAGGWLGGKRFTRRRQFCDDACKMTFARRTSSEWDGADSKSSAGAAVVIDSDVVRRKGRGRP